ncbi:hypothetical protein QTN25_003729 [Entamoeba marina]
MSTTTLLQLVETFSYENCNTSLFTKTATNIMAENLSFPLPEDQFIRSIQPIFQTNTSIIKQLYDVYVVQKGEAINPQIGVEFDGMMQVIRLACVARGNQQHRLQFLYKEGVDFFTRLCIQNERETANISDVSLLWVLFGGNQFEFIQKVTSLFTLDINNITIDMFLVIYFALWKTPLK